MNHKTNGTIVAVAALMLDQSSKAIVIENAAALSNGIAVFPSFNLVYLRNDGVAFGLLGGLPWWVLTVLSLSIVSFLVICLLRAQRAVEGLAYGMIIGGALGNVTDRLRFGAVTDFLDVYVGTWHWPVFNLADVAVSCGVAVLLISEVWVFQRQSAKKL